MPDKPITAEPQKPRRRWFQFRLRTLLIGVLLLAIPLGYVAHEATIFLERKKWLKDTGPPPFDASHHYAIVSAGDPRESPGITRRWLGDRPQSSIAISPYIPRKELDEAARLFPEAAFYYDGERD